MKYDKNKAFDYENGFMLTSEIYRMGNFLAHYELYKKILSVPGDVVELGVFKGNSLVQFASFRHLLENERARKIIGFDVFGRFPENAGGQTSPLFPVGTKISKTSLCPAKKFCPTLRQRKSAMWNLSAAIF